MRHRTGAWLCLFVLISCIQPATAFAQADIAPASDDIETLAKGSDALLPCVGEYMRSHPLDETTGQALIEMGLASEMKARALAVLGAQSRYRRSLAKLDISRPEDVGNVFYILIQEIENTRSAVDRRPFQLAAAVFNFYIAKLAGTGCAIDPDYAARVQEARIDRLAPVPGLDFDALKMQREIDQAALCAFGHFSPHAQGSEQINAYIAEHGDLEGLREDVEAFTSHYGDDAGKAALASVPVDASPGERLAGYMSVLIGAERSPTLAMANRYRASALSAYHLVRATDNSCKLGKPPLELIGKE